VRKQGLIAKTIRVKIRDHHFKTYSRSKTIHAETCSSGTIYQVASALVKNWFNEHRNAPVRLLGVGVANFEAPPERADAQSDETVVPALDRTLDEINTRFGSGIVGRALGKLRNK